MEKIFATDAGHEGELVHDGLLQKRKGIKFDENSCVLG